MLSLIDQARYNAFLKANDTASAAEVLTESKYTSDSEKDNILVNNNSSFNLLIMDTPEDYLVLT